MESQPPLKMYRHLGATVQLFPCETIPIVVNTKVNDSSSLSKADKNDTADQLDMLSAHVSLNRQSVLSAKGAANRQITQ